MDTELTTKDYEMLITMLDDLIDVVGENENHVLAPLMDLIGNLIEKCRAEIEEDNEEGFGMKVRNYPLGTGMPKPHRPEKVGRPANLPRVKLADLLAQETDDTASEEIDTGPPVGNEVW